VTKDPPRTLKGAAGSQICQSGAAMPDCVAPLMATNRLASVTVIMFALQNRTCTRSAPTQTGVTEPLLSHIKTTVCRCSIIHEKPCLDLRN
jgi:hypothetical protein